MPISYLYLKPLQPTTEWFERPFVYDRPTDTSWCFNYPLNKEGRVLALQWGNTMACEDEVISGVLADWCEEHRDSLLEGATGPTDPVGGR